MGGLNICSPGEQALCKALLIHGLIWLVLRSGSSEETAQEAACQ